MCNLSVLVREDGRKEGLQEGRKEGRKEGRREGLQKGRKEGLQKGRESVVLRMLMLKKYDDEEIIQLSEISKERLEELKAELARA